MTRRILLIGVDAGSFDTIEPLIDKGAMPNLAALLDSGYRAPLEGPTPPWLQLHGRVLRQVRTRASTKYSMSKLRTSLDSCLLAM